MRETVSIEYFDDKYDDEIHPFCRTLTIESAEGQHYIIENTHDISDPQDPILCYSGAVTITAKTCQQIIDALTQTLTDTDTDNAPRAPHSNSNVPPLDAQTSPLAGKHSAS